MRQLTPHLVSLSLVAAAAGCSGDDPSPPTTAALEILTTSLPAGAEGSSYDAVLEATGGAGSYAWTVGGGALPAGLVLTGSGTPDTRLSGRPTENGTFEVTIEVTDDAGNTAEQSYVLEIRRAAVPVAITTTELPGAATDTEYSATITAENGSGAGYSWAVASGALPDGLAISPDGTPSTTLAGTPTAPGTFEFTVRVTDDEGGSDDQAFSITVQDTRLPLEIVTTNLPAGQAARPYTAELEGANGAGVGYTWTVASGALPEGLTLATEGTPTTAITGTPDAEGHHSFAVQLEDAAGNRVTKSFVLDVAPAPRPLRIIEQTLPGGEVNVLYSATLSAINGSETDYTWSVTAGALPPGLTLASEGTPETTLDGTPTTEGSFAFTIQVEDSFGFTDEVEYEVEVIPEILPVEIATTSTVVPPNVAIPLPEGSVGDPYTATIEARNGVPPYNWVVTEGALPVGLDVVVSGTPSTQITGIAGEVGTFTATISVFDQLNQSASKAFTITVTAPEDPIVILTPTVPDAEACNSYLAEVIAADGSNNDYVWSIDSGALPPGLTLDPMGTPSTFIRGTVSSEDVGVHNFTVRVTDSNGGTTTQPMSIEVMDTGSGQRWLAIVGDIFVDNDIEVSLADICSATPGAPVAINPPSPGVGDAGTAVGDVVFSADGSKVAFIGDFTTDGSDDAFVVDLSTGAPGVPVNVTNFGDSNLDAAYIALSPDGSWLAIQGDGEVDAVTEMFVVDVSDLSSPGALVKVSGPMVSGGDAVTADFLFSPDSQKLVYLADQDVDLSDELYLVDLSVPPVREGNVKLHADLTEGSGHDVDDYFLFTPDGSGIILVADLAVYNDLELWLVDVSNPASPGAPLRLNGPLVSGGDVIISDFDLSPDGTKLFYMADETTDLVNELYLVDLSGPTPGPSMRVHPPLGSDSDLFNAVWSPDSTTIVGRGDIDVNAINELYAFDVSGALPATPVKVNGVMQASGDVGASTTDIQFSPDGRWFAYIADQDFEAADEVYVVNMETGVPGPSMRVNPPFTSGDFDISSFAFSPDSSKIAFQGDVQVNSQTELWVADVSGSAPSTPYPAHGPLMSGMDVNTFDWKSDSSGLFLEADLVVDNDTEAWFVDVTNLTGPGTPVAINPTLPANGDVSVIHVQ